MFKDNIHDLMQQFSTDGELVWIGLRPEKKQPMTEVNEILADCQNGLAGDHYSGRSGKRHVTMIQWEHLAVLESFTGKSISPGLLRRNLVIRGINLRGVSTSLS